MGTRRFGILLCADDSDYLKKQYGGLSGVFIGMLAEEGEAWDVFRPSTGELPNESRLNEYDGFVITGSCRDAHGDDLWISDLCSLLQRLHAMRKRVLGICFGHQVLCRALGGKIGRAKAWDIGVTSVHISSCKTLPFTRDAIPSSIPVIQCHRDEITELPVGAEVLASSDKTKVEMFGCGEHIFGIQGHPEYTHDILLHLLQRLLQNNLITENYAEEVKVNLEGKRLNREAWEKACKSFLKGSST